jgi:hypothetical protein
MVTFEDLKTGKVKPEFGNIEHITVVREYERFQAMMEEEQQLKLWEVTFSVSGTCTVRVRADSREEAEEKAREEIDYTDMELDDCDVLEVEEKEEDAHAE